MSLPTTTNPSALPIEPTTAFPTTTEAETPPALPTTTNPSALPTEPTTAFPTTTEAETPPALPTTTNPSALPTEPTTALPTSTAETSPVQTPTSGLPTPTAGTSPVQTPTAAFPTTTADTSSVPIPTTALPTTTAETSSAPISTTALPTTTEPVTSTTQLPTTSSVTLSLTSPSLTSPTSATLTTPTPTTLSSSTVTWTGTSTPSPTWDPEGGAKGPGTHGADDPLSTGAKVGIVAAILVVIAVVLILYLAIYRRQNDGLRQVKQRIQRREEEKLAFLTARFPPSQSSMGESRVSSSASSNVASPMVPWPDPRLSPTLTETSITMTAVGAGQHHPDSYAGLERRVTLGRQFHQNRTSEQSLVVDMTSSASENSSPPNGLALYRPRSG